MKRFPRKAIGRAPPCLLCGSVRASRIFGRVRGTRASFVFRCRTCRFTFLHPRMSERSQRRFYREAFGRYMVERGAGHFADPGKHRRSSRTDNLRRIGQLRSWLKPGWDILEIGSSSGSWLSTVRPHVRSVAGLELDPRMAAYARRHGVPTFKHPSEIGDRLFDAVFLFFVLEHLTSPIEFLAYWRNRLRPGGALVIEVPNVRDALLEWYKIPSFERFYWQKAHGWYFEPITLARALRLAGLSANMIPVQRYDLSNHLCWFFYGLPGGTGRFRRYWEPQLDQAYQEDLIRLGFHDTILALASVEK